MPRLTDSTEYAFAQAEFASERLWEFFDGDRTALNIAHECVDRHATDASRIAVRVAHSDGEDEAITFRDLSAWSSRVAHWLQQRGVAPGERVAVMLDPSLGFYGAMFGAMKRGAVAVPLFTLFGPEGVRLRVADCAPRILLTSAEKVEIAQGVPGVQVVVADAAWMAELAALPTTWQVTTRPDEMALFQHTSGTTRELPAAVKHTHRSVVVLMAAAFMRHRHSPGRRVLLPLVARLGARVGAWHAGAARPRRHHRHLCGAVRSGAADAGFAGFRHHQPLRRRDALPDDAHEWAGAPLPLQSQQALLYGRADRCGDAAVHPGHLRRAGVQHAAPRRWAWRW